MAEKTQQSVIGEYVETVLKPRREAKAQKKAAALTPVSDGKPQYPPKPGQIIVDFDAALNRVLRRDFDSLIKPAGMTWETLWSDMPNAAFVVVEYFDGTHTELQNMQLRFDRGDNFQFQFQAEAMRRLKSLHAPVLMSAGQIVSAAIRAYGLKRA